MSDKTGPMNGSPYETSQNPDFYQKPRISFGSKPARAKPPKVISPEALFSNVPIDDIPKTFSAIPVGGEMSSKNQVIISPERKEMEEKTKLLRQQLDKVEARMLALSKTLEATHLRKDLGEDAVDDADKNLQAMLVLAAEKISIAASLDQLDEAEKLLQDLDENIEVLQEEVRDMNAKKFEQVLRLEEIRPLQAHFAVMEKRAEKLYSTNIDQAKKSEILELGSALAWLRDNPDSKPDASIDDVTKDLDALEMVLSEQEAVLISQLESQKTKQKGLISLIPQFTNAQTRAGNLTGKISPTEQDDVSRLLQDVSWIVDDIDSDHTTSVGDVSSRLTKIDAFLSTLEARVDQESKDKQAKEELARRETILLAKEFATLAQTYGSLHKEREGVLVKSNDPVKKKEAEDIWKTIEMVKLRLDQDPTRVDVDIFKDALKKFADTLQEIREETERLEKLTMGSIFVMAGWPKQRFFLVPADQKNRKPAFWVLEKDDGSYKTFDAKETHLWDAASEAFNRTFGEYQKFFNVADPRERVAQCQNLIQAKDAVVKAILTGDIAAVKSAEDSFESILLDTKKVWEKKDAEEKEKGAVERDYKVAEVTLANLRKRTEKMKLGPDAELATLKTQLETVDTLQKEFADLLSNSLDVAALREKLVTLQDATAEYAALLNYEEKERSNSEREAKIIEVTLVGLKKRVEKLKLLAKAEGETLTTQLDEVETTQKSVTELISKGKDVVEIKEQLAALQEATGEYIATLKAAEMEEAKRNQEIRQEKEGLEREFKRIVTSLEVGQKNIEKWRGLLPVETITSLDTKMVELKNLQEEITLLFKTFDAQKIKEKLDLYNDKAAEISPLFQKSTESYEVKERERKVLLEKLKVEQDYFDDLDKRTKKILPYLKRKDSDGLENLEVDLFERKLADIRREEVKIVSNPSLEAIQDYKKVLVAYEALLAKKEQVLLKLYGFNIDGEKVLPTTTLNPKASVVMRGGKKTTVEKWQKEQDRQVKTEKKESLKKSDETWKQLREEHLARYSQDKSAYIQKYAHYKWPSKGSSDGYYEHLKVVSQEIVDAHLKDLEVKQTAILKEKASWEEELNKPGNEQIKADFVNTITYLDTKLAALKKEIEFIKNEPAAVLAGSALRDARETLSPEDDSSFDGDPVAGKAPLNQGFFSGRNIFGMRKNWREVAEAKNRARDFKARKAAEVHAREEYLEGEGSNMEHIGTDGVVTPIATGNQALTAVEQLVPLSSEGMSKSITRAEAMNTPNAYEIKDAVRAPDSAPRAPQPNMTPQERSVVMKNIAKFTDIIIKNVSGPLKGNASYVAVALASAALGLAALHYLSKDDGKMEDKPKTYGEMIARTPWQDYLSPEAKAALPDLVGSKEISYAQFIKKYAPKLNVDENNPSTIVAISAMECQKLLNSQEVVYGLDPDKRDDACHLTRLLENVVQATEGNDRKLSPNFRQNDMSFIYSHPDIKNPVTINSLYSTARELATKATLQEEALTKKPS